MCLQCEIKIVGIVSSVNTLYIFPFSRVKNKFPTKKKEFRQAVINHFLEVQHSKYKKEHSMYLNFNSSPSRTSRARDKHEPKSTEETDKENGKSDWRIFLKHYFAIKNKSGLWQ